jgi:hypothetical protein
MTVHDIIYTYKVKEPSIVDLKQAVFALRYKARDLAAAYLGVNANDLSQKDIEKFVLNSYSFDVVEIGQIIRYMREKYE